MDKSEELAGMVIASVQMFIDKKMAPIVEAIAAVKRDLEGRGFLTKDEAVGLFARADIAERQASELRGDLKALGDRVAAAPTIDFLRAEASTAAIAACTGVAAAFPKPEPGKSVTPEDVRPMLEQMVEQRVAAIPKPEPGQPGKDADPAAVAVEVARQIALVPAPKDGASIDLGAIFTEIGAAVGRAVEALPKAKDGESITVEDVRPLIEKAIADGMATFRQPADGTSITAEDVRPLIAEAVSALPKAVDGTSVTVDDVRPLLVEMVAALPKPEDGKSVTLADIGPLIAKAVADEVAAIPRPEDGKSVTIEDVRPLIDGAIAAIPKPEDGKSVTPEDVRPMLAEMVAAIPPTPAQEVRPELVSAMVRAEVERAVAEIPEPKDGTSVHPDTVRVMVTDAVADAVAKAITLLPPIEPERVDMDEVRRLLADEVTRTLATWERPKDGDDGLGFDDMAMDLKDGRTMVFRFTRDGRERAFEIVAPWQIYRGIHKSGGRYQKGDTVTFAGSQFTAKTETDKSPETDDWVLSVKRGKDAR